MIKMLVGMLLGLMLLMSTAALAAPALPGMSGSETVKLEEAADMEIASNLGAVNPNNAKVEETADTEELQDAYPNPVRDVMATFGKIIEIEGNQITIKGEGNYPVVKVNINKDTYLLDGRNGRAKDMDEVRIGHQVTAYYSSSVSRSIPPQSNGFALVFGKNLDKIGKFTKVYSVRETEDGVVILNSNRDIEATISTEVYPECRSLREGDSLMLWYTMMTMSIPGKTNVEKVVKL